MKIIRGKTSLTAIAVVLSVAHAPAQQTNSNGASSSSNPAPYLGQFATRSFQNNNEISSANGWQMTRSQHTARSACSTGVTVVLGNWRLNNAVEDTSGYGAGTVKASIEYPAGSFTLASQNSSGPVAFPVGNTTLNFNTPTIPEGAVFYVRVLIQSNYNIPFRQPQNSYEGQAPGDGWTNGTGTANDLTTSGTVPQNVIWYSPLVVACTITKPSFLIVGDSRDEGGTEGCTTYACDVGMSPRGIGSAFGYSSMAQSGSLASQYASGSHTYEQAAAQYFSTVIDDYGVNDMNGGGETAAQTAGYRTAIAGFYPTLPVIGTTIEPVSTTTDGFYSQANEAQATSEPTILAFNTLVRSGISGEASFWDYARALDPSDSGLWPLSAIQGATAYSPNTQVSMTACIGATSACASPGNNLYVTAVAAGTLHVGDTVVDNLTGSASNSQPGTQIQSQTSGTTGGVGVYVVNKYPQQVASTTFHTGGLCTKDGLHQTQLCTPFVRAPQQFNFATTLR